MTIDTDTNETRTSLTTIEERALRAIRDRYHEDRDLFSERELVKLRFFKWLFQSGRLDS